MLKKAAQSKHQVVMVSKFINAEIPWLYCTLPASWNISQKTMAWLKWDANKPNHSAYQSYPQAGEICIMRGGGWHLHGQHGASNINGPPPWILRLDSHQASLMQRRPQIEGWTLGSPGWECGRDPLRRPKICMKMGRHLSASVIIILNVCTLLVIYKFQGTKPIQLA